MSAKERYNCATHRFEASKPNVEQFLKEIGDLCLKHGLSISHEDRHGGFIIEKYNQETVDWLNDASDDTDD